MIYFGVVDRIFFFSYLNKQLNIVTENIDKLYNHGYAYFVSIFFSPDFAAFKIVCIGKWENKKKCVYQS